MELQSLLEHEDEGDSDADDVENGGDRGLSRDGGGTQVSVSV